VFDQLELWRYNGQLAAGLCLLDILPGLQGESLVRCDVCPGPR
jgi:hypothetical protein